MPNWITTATGLINYFLLKALMVDLLVNLIVYLQSLKTEYVQQKN
jgi:hypothetical protein